MAGPRYDARSAVSLNQPQRTTRSWTSPNGLQYTVDTTSWHGPGPFTTFAAPSRPRQPNSHFGGALFGTAFGLLDDFARAAMHPQHTVIGDSMGQGATTRRVHIHTDSDDEDDHLAYGNGLESPTAQRKKNNRRSLLGRLKDRIVDSSHPRRQDSSSTSRSQSPASRPRIPQRPGNPERSSGSYRTETREPDYVQQNTAPEYIEVDYHDEPEQEPVGEPRRSRSRRQSVTEAEMIEALENAVEMERRNVRDCKMALTQASRQSHVSSTYLQRIVDELKQHESTLADAIGALNDAKATQHRNSRPPARARSQPRIRAQPRQSRPTAPPRSFEEEFLDPFGGFSPFFNRHIQRPDMMFRAFDDMHDAHFARTANHFDAFERLFEQTRPAPDDAHFRFFSMPGVGVGPQPERKRQRNNTQPNVPPPAYSSTNFQPAPPPPPPQPPATILRPDEAKRLFKTYNDRWNTLPSTSSDIPYPARGLHAGGLVARDSLWAPNVSEHVSNWSEETVMQANTQAFFLGVVGLVPMYTQNPGTARIECGFDRASARKEQIEDLVGLLKREKIRWHSDRLGRRSDGRGGVNVGLQRDERARAVFHAVCELMERANAV
ncbi:hypothetical protein AC578_4627 [Pseudocercospora eumusae]|uniref:Uncharacterized protein n=1 Tax=Pseudocercospora eumusae TaxID=321146 RepID=A0A139GZ90_9PEZI|nr:hypothetical protein AC578_4627 [Pseudocercospora eumusae]